MSNLSAGGDGGPTARRHRYTRSSTASVTQLLSDGYSSIMSRLTRRGPSEKPDPLADAKLSSARTRYDDKLSGVRRYDHATHVSPYSSLSSDRKPVQGSTYLGYLSGSKRIDNSPLRSSGCMSAAAVRRSDSFRRAHLKDSKASPAFTKRYPLKETNNNIDDALFLGSTRSRLEDKYSSVLDKIAHQKKERARREKEDRDKTLEPEPIVSRGLMRSLTTAVFGEKSFNRALLSTEKTRDKTPYRNTAERRLPARDCPLNDYKNGFGHLGEREVLHGKDRNSVYRRHQRRSLRAEKSENGERKTKLSLRPVDVDLHGGSRDLVSPIAASLAQSAAKSKLPKTPASSPAREYGRQKQIYFPSSDEDDDKTPVADTFISERETRRKEIQGLIMKYAHLDEVYDRIGDKDLKNGVAAPAECGIKREPLAVGDVVALPPELRSRQRALRPRHLMRRAATPPVSTNRGYL